MIAYNRCASKESYRTYLVQLAEKFSQGGDVYEEFDTIAECLQLAWDAQTRLREKGYGHSGLNILKTVELVPAR